jgi:transposase-like protein
MDPQEQFCHNPACPNRGQRGRGNICIHSRKEQRYRCSTCGRTFASKRPGRPPKHKLQPTMAMAA